MYRSLFRQTALFDGHVQAVIWVKEICLFVGFYQVWYFKALMLYQVKLFIGLAEGSRGKDATQHGSITRRLSVSRPSHGT